MATPTIETAHGELEIAPTDEKRQNAESDDPETNASQSDSPLERKWDPALEAKALRK